MLAPEVAVQIGAFLLNFMGMASGGYVGTSAFYGDYALYFRGPLRVGAG